jgi:hypothetical protein
MQVMRLEEWCVEAGSAEEAQALLASGAGHRGAPSAKDFTSNLLAYSTNRCRPSGINASANLILHRANTGKG